MRIHLCRFLSDVFPHALWASRINEGQLSAYADDHPSMEGKSSAVVSNVIVRIAVC